MGVDLVLCALCSGQCENLQKVGAFKYRGALNAVKKFLQEKEQKGEKGDTTFVTHSSGNHAQALALAARDANCKAVIVMVSEYFISLFGWCGSTNASLCAAAEQLAQRQAKRRSWLRS